MKPATITQHGSLETPLLIDARGVAKLLGVCVRQVWKMLANGALPSPVRPGGLTRWRFDELKRWVAEGCPPATIWNVRNT